MKKIKFIALLIFILFMIPVTAYAASKLEKIEVYKNYAGVEVNGRKLSFKTFLYGKTQYAPVEELLKALNAKINWNEKKKILSISSDAGNTTT